ncbi:hypothetical protein PHYPSEUDO_013485 [Phytophthora pseudosyringae]|uniref:Uncharacterized protein n=1 Tax=Phytophthora pseudosyringae TaxID=221518 RepID=A0A8T1WGQ0_9STRA|nr:hypothetical protein PHYPSEUDO_013485 [Phytophthora pseudosyringae]
MIEYSKDINFKGRRQVGTLSVPTECNNLREGFDNQTSSLRGTLTITVKYTHEGWLVFFDKRDCAGVSKCSPDLAAYNFDNNNFSYQCLAMQLYLEASREHNGQHYRRGQTPTRRRQTDRTADSEVPCHVGLASINGAFGRAARPSSVHVATNPKISARPSGLIATAATCSAMHRSPAALDEWSRVGVTPPPWKLKQRRIRLIGRSVALLCPRAEADQATIYNVN